MPLAGIRLELARTPEFPAGSARHGYQFTAQLTADGELDRDGWRRDRGACRVVRFWPGEDHQHGHLVHHRGGQWAFQYHDMAEAEQEPIFRFDRHGFVAGEYVAVTEHDGVQRTFRGGPGDAAGGRLGTGAVTTVERAAAAAKGAS